LNVQFTEDDRIYWICPTCGDDGIIDGWHGLIWDVSFYDEEDRVVH
jgi:RNA polymerase subunit RPABC4/transcription elongation factor Spt4